MQDKAIEFEATRFKVSKTIDNLNNAGLSIEKFQRIYNQIITELNLSNKAIPDSIIETNNGFATDCLKDNYNKAIKQLDLLYLELVKYKVYVQVASFAKYLKLFIDNPNKTKDDFSVYRHGLIDILNKLINSQTLDYDVEGSIIEEIYQITYYFIKEEIRYFQYSETLNTLNNNQIHLLYLNKQINRELETMDLKQPKYRELLIIKNRIDSNDFDSNYVTIEFIKQLMIYELNKERVNQIINDLIFKIRSNIEDLNNSLEKVESNRLYIKNNGKKEIKKELFQNILLLITSISITAGIIVGSIKIVQRSGRKYNNITTTYSITDGINKTSEYKINTTPSTIIYELEPFRKVFTSYIRFIHTYDVSELETMPIEDYLNLDLDNLDIKHKMKVETTKDLKLDELYNETIRYVKQLTIDKQDYQFDLEIALPVFFLLIIICLPLIVIKEGIFYEHNQYYNELIEEIIACLKEINNIKTSDIVKQKEIDSLNKKYKQIILENEELIKKILTYQDIIKTNPEYNEELEKITNTLKLVKKK